MDTKNIFMKTFVNHIIVCWFLLSLTTHLHAQTFFSIGNDANLFIGAKTNISFDSLVLTSSTDMLLTPTGITKSTTLFHTATGTHINRVYQFSQPFADFNGTIDFGYQDDELNGLDENTLVLNAFTNNTWTAYTNDVSRDATNNYITTSGLSNISLDELTLTSIAGVLPLHWLSVTATRENSLTVINWITTQEANCKYYQVQKSTDVVTWQNVGSPVKAMNGNSFNYYSFSDAFYLDSTAYYRIVLTDINGKTSYSTIVSVKDANDNRIVIYPNPASDIISVHVGGNARIRSVKVYDAIGKLMMSKEGSNSDVYSFSVNSLLGGFYMMMIETNTGKVSKGFVKR